MHGFCSDLTKPVSQKAPGDIVQDLGYGLCGLRFEGLLGVKGSDTGFCVSFEGAVVAFKPAAQNPT